LFVLWKVSDILCDFFVFELKRLKSVVGLQSYAFCKYKSGKQTYYLRILRAVLVASCSATEKVFAKVISFVCKVKACSLGIGVKGPLA